MASTIYLDMGDENSFVYGTLEWENLYALSARRVSHAISIFNPLHGLNSIRIVQNKVKLRLDTQDDLTVLKGEVVELNFKLQNDDLKNFKNIKITCKQLEEEPSENRPLSSLHFITAENSVVPVLNQDLTTTLNHGALIDFKLRLCSQAPSNTQFSINVTATDGGSAIIEKGFTFDLLTREPFVVRSSARSVNNEPVNWFLHSQESIIQADVEAVSNLTILSIQWALNQAFEVVEEPDEAENLGPKGCQLESGDVLSPCVVVNPIIENPTLKDLSLGKLVVTWKRPRSINNVRTQLDLGKLPAIRVPLIVSSRVLDSVAVVRRPIPVEFSLISTHDEVLDLKLTLERSDVFMFCGYKELSIRLLPGCSYQTHVTLLALSAGRLPFPKLVIESTVADQNPIIEKYSLKCLPSTLFVLPSSWSQTDPTHHTNPTKSTNANVVQIKQTFTSENKIKNDIYTQQSLELS